MSIPKFEDVAASMTVPELRRLLGDRVRHERKKMGQTQLGFAGQCGVPFSTFKRFEAGDCDSLEVLLAIITVFNRRVGLDLLFPTDTTLKPRSLLARYEEVMTKHNKTDL